MQAIVDIQVENCGGMYVITPMTPAAREWVEENCDVADLQWMGASFAMDDKRLAIELIQGALDAGLNCE
jgi:hypothetical protein